MTISKKKYLSSDFENIDVAYIGAGLSTAFTLIRKLEQLLHAKPARRLQVAVIEKTGEFFPGIAYGFRSGHTSLTITPLKEFLPEEERELFTQWLKDNHQRCNELLHRHGGELSKDWLERSHSCLANADCDSIHVPRFYYGIYLQERLSELLDKCHSKELVTCHLVHAEVVEVERCDLGYKLKLNAEPGVICAKQVVLAIGMPPTRKIFSGVTQGIKAPTLIEDPYIPSLAENLELIGQAISAKESDSAGLNLLIVGANATSLEMIYQIKNIPYSHTAAKLRVTVIAPQGNLPARYNEREKIEFLPKNLRQLNECSTTTSQEILEAVRQDITDASLAELDISQSLPAISSAVGELLGKLDEHEKLLFVNHTGPEIGRLQRRAGNEYSDIVDHLRKDDAITIVAGHYLSANVNADGILRVLVKPKGSDSSNELPTEFDIAINCSGPNPVSLPSNSKVIDSLIASGLCRPTIAHRGFKLDEDMQSAPSLYVIGPMMSGNVVGATPIWHVEHCGRIINFAAQLAPKILNRVLRDSAKNNSPNT